MSECVRIGKAELWHGDAREIAGCIDANACISDPVWPTCPPGLLPGADGAQGELARAVFAALRPKTLVVVLGWISNQDGMWERGEGLDAPSALVHAQAILASRVRLHERLEASYAERPPGAPA